MKLKAEITIHSDLEALWQRTQVPEQHQRWDLRFSRIEYLPKESPSAPQHFRYVRRLTPRRSIEGWGETRSRSDKRSSALRFGTDDPLSLIQEGTGSWVYHQREQAIHFCTVYDYDVRYGRLGALADRLAFRPLMVWATRWSFDRLRLWIEREITPELSWHLWLLKLVLRTMLALFWFYDGLLFKLLFPSSDEIELIQRSHLTILTLPMIGMAEIVLGFWLLSGKAEHYSALAVSLMTSLPVLLLSLLQPETFFDPVRCLPKIVALLLCTVAICFLAPLTPQAWRARPERNQQS